MSDKETPKGAARNAAGLRTPERMGHGPGWRKRDAERVPESLVTKESMPTTAPTITLLVGHVLDKLRTLPDASVHCVVTSPPYWGLRDYSRCECAIGTVKQDDSGNRTYYGFNEQWKASQDE